MKVVSERASLLVVDIQTRLVPAMHSGERVVANAGILMASARRLGIPLLVSEQYPRGLGPTVPELSKYLSEKETFEKVEFSCLGNAAYRRAFESLGRKQVVVTGIEAHVCVMQTVLDLLDAGYETAVVADAVSSRTPENHRHALDRMARAGAEIVTTEMVVFEWLGKAGTPEFKELSALIR